MKVQGHGQAKVLTGEEINKLFAALKGDRNQALFAFLPDVELMKRARDY